jgi:serine/threonine-protein kinase HipA
MSQETAQDLVYLQGKGTSLGGMRPKCTVLDEDGHLAIGKFPSISDQRSVTRGEVLALHLAQMAGIQVPPSRVAVVGETPVAVIRRFDRTPDHGRIPYLSAASVLQASRDDDHAYTELADAIRARSPQPTEDVQQLWRRMVFNLLITNVDDHLQNLGFLHQGQGFWSLAPAFDLNPFPDKERESKTWLSPEQGPITSIDMLLQAAPYFSLTPAQASATLAQVVDAVGAWRTVARSPAVGLSAHELTDFADAFEHGALQAAHHHLGR